jgi:hypothetical protein
MNCGKSLQIDLMNVSLEVNRGRDFVYDKLITGLAQQCISFQQRDWHLL